MYLKLQTNVSVGQEKYNPAEKCADKIKGQTRLKLIETESTWHLQFEEFLLCRMIITPFECADE